MTNLVRSSQPKPPFDSVKMAGNMPIHPNTTAADDIHKEFFIVFRKK